MRYLLFIVRLRHESFFIANVKRGKIFCNFCCYSNDKIYLSANSKAFFFGKKSM